MNSSILMLSIDFTCLRKYQSFSTLLNIVFTAQKRSKIIGEYAKKLKVARFARSVVLRPL